MEHEHLDGAALDRMLALDRTEDQNRSLLHQLATCSVCYRAAGYLLDLYRAGLLKLQFSTIDVALARSRMEAPGLWDRLESLIQEERLTSIRTDPTFQSWGLCELLCRYSDKAGAGKASEAVQLAELAVEISEAIEHDAPTEDHWIYLLRAHTWAHLANARRVYGDPKGAETAFETSDHWWAAGAEEVGDALGYEPLRLELKASLRSAQRRFPEALALLDQVIHAYLQEDSEGRDPHLAGQAMVQQGHVLMESGRLNESVEALRRAGDLLDSAREPRLLLCLRHNLVDNLTKAGRYAEARALLPEVQALSQEIGNHLDRVRLRWVEGRISAGLGEAEAAREAFGEVRRAFLAQGIAYDAALVSLELAILHLKAGETAAVRELAREMVVIFQAQEVHREALAALAIFQTAAALETATAELAEEIAAYLVRARQEPGMRFETA